jgi:two-component system phosphate regulon sensor histidine kinase PhoR
LLTGHVVRVAVVLAALLRQRTAAAGIAVAAQRPRTWCRCWWCLGDVIGLIASCLDASSTTSGACAKLRELRHSTAAIPDGVVMLNPAAEILWFNRSAAELLSLRSPGDVGLRIDNLVRRPEFVNYLRNGDYHSPVVVQGAGISEQHLQFQVVPYGAGRLLLMVRDVTRQMRLEAMRKDFVANASHELRSPLTVISGYLETLAQEESLDPVLHGQRCRRCAAGVRMTAIVQDLLELAPGGGRYAQRRAGRCRRSVDALAQDLLARHALQLQVRMQVDTPDRLRGEPAQLHSAFANLLDNAAKYTPAGGSVVMRWWRDEHGGYLSVTDTGIGISPEHIPRLTERFYRVDAGRSRASGGSGLGLAIVKHVLQRHDASLQIVRKKGAAVPLPAISCGAIAPACVRRRLRDAGRISFAAAGL